MEERVARWLQRQLWQRQHVTMAKPMVLQGALPREQMFHLRLTVALYSTLGQDNEIERPEMTAHIDQSV